MRPGLKVIARALIGSLLWTIASPALFPWALEAQAASPDQSKQTSQAPTRVELPEYRTEHSKRFQNPNGTITDEVSLDPIHYLDKRSGKWQPIDMSLSSTNEPGFNYETRGGRLKGYLATNLTGPEWLRLTLDQQYEVRLRPMGLGRSTASIHGPSAHFSEVMSGTDVDWQFNSSNAVGKVAVRSEEAAKHPLRLQVRTTGLEVRQESDGAIGLYDVSGIRQFTIPVPSGTDSAGKPVPGRIQMQQSQVGTFLEFNVDTSMVNAVASADLQVAAAGATYPVTFPVTIVADQMNSRDTHVAQVPQWDDYYGADKLKVGPDKESGTTRSLLWFPLPSLPAGKYVVGADLVLQADSANISPKLPMKVDVFRAMNSWTSSGVTWTNQPSLGAVAESTSTVTGDGKFAWNVTGLVYEWYHKGLANNGFVLKASDENPSGMDAVSFFSSDLGWVGSQPPSEPDLRWPLLAITYNDPIDPLGQQPFWSYAGNVNIANGNLTLGAVDTAIPGVGLTATITRVYNSRSTFSGAFGYGWTSELDRQIVTDPADKNRLAYVEPDGSVHHFTMASDGFYYGPEGLFLKIKKEADGAYTLSPLTGFPQYNFASNGRILSITDAEKNSVTYTWSLPSSITIKDPANRTIALTLTNNLITKMTDIAGQTTTYTYTTAGDLATVTVGGKTTSYRYDSSHNLVQVTSTGGSNAHFVYSSQDRVISTAPVNMIPNAGLEVNGTGGKLPTYWNIASGGESYATTTQAQGFTGSHGKYLSIYLTPPTNTSSAWGVYLSEPITLNLARRYVLSGRYQSSQTTGGSTDVKAVLSVMAYDSAGNSLGEFAKEERLGPKSSWDQVTSAFDAFGKLPANTATIRVKIAGSKVGAKATILWDDVQLEEVAAGLSTALTFVSPTTYTWDAVNLASAAYDGNGKKIKWEYNRWGNSTKVTVDPDGLNATTTYTWLSPYLNSQSKNPLGGLINREYDASGNVISVKQGIDGDVEKYGKTTYGYNATNLLAWEKSSLSPAPTELTYTEQQNPTVKSPLGIATGAVERDHSTCKGCILSETPSLSVTSNLLSNFNFERWSGSVPTGWTWNNKGTVRASTISEKPHGGAKALAITPNAATYVDLTQRVSAKAETYYTLSLYVWGATDLDAGQGGGVVSFYDAAGNLLTDEASVSYHWSNKEAKAGRWNRLIVTAKSPKTTATALVGVYANGNATPGTILIDSLQFEEAPYVSAFNLIENGGLEQGTSTSPDQWAELGNGTWTTTTAFSGAKALQLSGATSQLSGLVQKDLMKYDPTQPLTLTAVVQTSDLTGAQVLLKLEWYDSAGTLKANTYSRQILRGTNGWTRLYTEVKPGSIKLDSGVDPAQFKVSILVSIDGAFANPWSVAFDSIRLEQSRIASSYLYNSTSGQVVRATNPRDESLEYTYDSYGRVLTATPNQNANQGVTYTWDSLGRLTKVNAPLGLQGEQVYDDDNRLRTVIRSVGNDKRTTEFDYTPPWAVEVSQDADQ